MSEDDGVKKTEPSKPTPGTSSWVVAALILGAIAAIYVVARRPAPPPPNAPPGEAHSSDPFGGMNAVHQAVLTAPEGATTCETAWNAFDAMERALKAAGQPSGVSKHPDRQTFLDVCAGFTDIEQRCLTPRFKDVNADRCENEGKGVWSEADSLRRKNLFTIFGPRDPAGAPSAPKSTAPLAGDAGGD